MKSSAWLSAMTLSAMSLVALPGGASAQQRLEAQLIPDNFAAPDGAMRLIPIPKQQQSPAASACANAGGTYSAEARLAGCATLIDSGKWKGREIAWAYANRCIVYHAQGETQKAQANCDAAIQQDPGSWLAYQMRGEIAEKLGSPDKALADYDKAIEVGARNAAIFVNRGDIFLAGGHADRALADFNKAIELNDRSVLAYIGRGGAFVARGDADSAIADFGKVIELAPDKAIAWFDRGAAFFAKGENARAAQDFTQALRLDPSNAYAAIWRFLARARVGDGDAAKAELLAGSAKISRTAWPWPAAQLFLGDKDAGETLAAAKSPGDQCEAQFYLGEERLLKNARDESLAYFRKAAEICPRNFSEYFQALNELKPPVDAAPRTGEEPPKAETAPKADETKDPVAKP
ncbi:tetratricopeptide repeat protein [uncultured Rhodoblastus sp.]|uniref:tetratricopeptide repeat protein n=1 Tax=uncultured Rhodoblastus sp. TaxID=543037 RepID=UPI0025EC1D5B|nr:tetratricopeptide repeat protein [uncultured Rhodoblastus sp.]